MPWSQQGDPWLCLPPLNDLNNWTLKTVPSVIKRGGNLVTDKKHKIIYSANGVSGLWRLVTE
jgi:hypothetical protein